MRVTTEIVHGAPYQAIVAYSERNNIDLLQACTYGRTAMTRLLLGSVVERVAMISTRPTLVVKRLGKKWGTRSDLRPIRHRSFYSPSSHSQNSTLHAAPQRTKHETRSSGSAENSPFPLSLRRFTWNSVKFFRD